MALVEKTNKPLKKGAGSKGASAAPVPIVDDDDDIFAVKENTGEDAVPKKKTPKKKTVEETYQKLTQLEHVLLRPDTYIGSTELNRTKLWVYDQDAGMTQRDVTYVPGLYKIFDEILVNAADNKQRDKVPLCFVRAGRCCLHSPHFGGMQVGMSGKVKLLAAP
jgi:DNA topoisomerase-2